MGPEFWEGERERLFDLLFPVVRQYTAQGAFAGWEMLQVGIDANWHLVNQTAREWARQYTYTLVSKINDTTRAALQSELEGWIQSGAPLDVLMDSLAPYFGPARAEAIAVTEVTRVYAEGNLLAWRSSGVVEGVRWMTAEDDDVCEICGPIDGQVADLERLNFPSAEGAPPAHPRCRCWLQPVVKER